MGFSIIHPIRREIDNQYYRIKTMIESYPSFMNDWLFREDEKYKMIARENAGGDSDVNHTIYSNLLYGMDVFYETDNYFYQAVFLVGYSYYESWLNKIGRNNKMLNENIGVRELKENCGFDLCNEIQNKVNYLFKTVKPFRNLIAHNNNGTLREEQKEVLNDIRQKYEHIDECDGIVTFNDDEFILDVLKMEHEILLEICNKLGYNTFVTK